MPSAARHNRSGLAALFLDETCVRLRQEAIGPYLDEFVEDLRALGYPPLTLRLLVGPVVHFGVWLARRDVVVRAIDGEVLDLFGRHLARCRCSRRSRVRRCGRGPIVRVAARHFLEHLRRRGIARPAPARTRLPSLVEEFEVWMRQHRGSADRTLSDYRPLAAAFVQSRRGRRWDHLGAAAVRSYVIDECKKLTPARRLVFVRALRMFMRFLVATGRCRSHLDRCVPSIPHWRLATLPRYLDHEVIERIVASRPKTTVCGLRDRAILLLLARLGLRAGEVRGLCFSDLDWARGQLRVVGKLRRPTWLPIPQDVGDAILAYLRVRPKCRHEQVFLCVPAPHRPLGATNVGNVCQRAIDELGVKATTKGAHIFRHSAATTLIRHGATLDDVGRLLRHASRESTAVYAKVAIDALRRITQPWPEAVR